MERMQALLRKYDHVVPWVILLGIAGGTLLVLQLLIVRLLR